MIDKLKAVWKDWTDPDDERVRSIRLQQLLLAARNAEVSTRAIPYTSTAIAAVLSFWAPWALMLAWWAATLLASVTLLRILKPYVEGDITQRGLKSAIVRLFTANILQMAVFAVLAPLAWVDGAPIAQALVLLVMCTAMASVATITGPSRAIFASDMIPLAVSATLTPVLLSGLDGLPVSGLSLLFAILMVENSKGAYLLAENALTLNDENVALIARLRASDRAKSEFLANMSHELRTPLNAILGFSEVMKDEMMGPMASPTYKSYAADIHGSGQHLLGLVNDILDLAKIEAGRVELADDVFSLGSIVEGAFQLFRVQAERASVMLVKDVADDVTIRWDLRAARQIAINLMSNALKFTPPGGTITVTSRRLDDGSAFITVRDTGCGIAAEDHERIFESFGQGRHDVASQEKSTGLGLAIIKGLVELHGGRLTVESNVGQGAAFTIVVPPERVLAAEGLRVAA